MTRSARLAIHVADATLKSHSGRKPKASIYWPGTLWRIWAHLLLAAVAGAVVAVAVTKILRAGMLS